MSVVRKWLSHKANALLKPPAAQDPRDDEDRYFTTAIEREARATVKTDNRQQNTELSPMAEYKPPTSEAEFAAPSLLSLLICRMKSGMSIPVGQAVIPGES